MSKRKEPEKPEDLNSERNKQKRSEDLKPEKAEQKLLLYNIIYNFRAIIMLLGSTVQASPEEWEKIKKFSDRVSQLIQIFSSSSSQLTTITPLISRPSPSEPQRLEKNPVLNSMLYNFEAVTNSLSLSYSLSLSPLQISPEGWKLIKANFDRVAQMIQRKCSAPSSSPLPTTALPISALNSSEQKSDASPVENFQKELKKALCAKKNFLQLMQRALEKIFTSDLQEEEKAKIFVTLDKPFLHRLIAQPEKLRAIDIERLRFIVGYIHDNFVNESKRSPEKLEQELLKRLKKPVKDALTTLLGHYLPDLRVPLDLWLEIATIYFKLCIIILEVKTPSSTPASKKKTDLLRFSIVTVTTDYLKLADSLKTQARWNSLLNCISAITLAGIDHGVLFFRNLDDILSVLQVGFLDFTPVDGVSINPASEQLRIILQSLDQKNEIVNFLLGNPKRLKDIANIIAKSKSEDVTRVLFKILRPLLGRSKDEIWTEEETKGGAHRIHIFWTYLISMRPDLLRLYLTEFFAVHSKSGAFIANFCESFNDEIIVAPITTYLSSADDSTRANIDNVHEQIYQTLYNDIGLTTYLNLDVCRVILQYSFLGDLDALLPKFKASSYSSCSFLGSREKNQPPDEVATYSSLGLTST